MRITIISGNGDNSVYVDGESRGDLDLSQCGLPENFWAFQWNEKGNNKGHIEFNSPEMQNQEVTEVPTWANNCVAVFHAKIQQEAAEEAAAAEAAKQAQTTGTV